MEDVVTPAEWAGRRVLVTGHTGFKGSWLALWLQMLGARVVGLADAVPTDPSLYELASVGEGMAEVWCDVRDLPSVLDAVSEHRPEVVFHLAAQSLVRASFADPVATYSVNVLGTAHVLEAVRKVGGVRAVVVTSDKCYDDRGLDRGFREDDALGGSDPYSSSKACAELVTAAYRRSFAAGDGPAIASGRAGNVVGGGDWATDRLVPDLVRAWQAGRPASVRNPDAIRPWQHVLEPVAGYLLLAERVQQDRALAAGWNFGPAEEEDRPVRWVADRLCEQLGDGVAWELDRDQHPAETRTLRLDSSAAMRSLGWRPRWSTAEAMDQTASWYRKRREGADPRALTLEQVAEYATLAL